MGCASSKRIEATVDVYRPAPASFSVFNIATIEEPWRKADDSEQELEEKPTHVPSPILEKLNALEGEKIYCVTLCSNGVVYITNSHFFPLKIVHFYQLNITQVFSIPLVYVLFHWFARKLNN